MIDDGGIGPTGDMWLAALMWLCIVLFVLALVGVIVFGLVTWL